MDPVKILILNIILYSRKMKCSMLNAQCSIFNFKSSHRLNTALMISLNTMTTFVKPFECKNVLLM